jgi:hypothetical protein
MASSQDIMYGGGLSLRCWRGLYFAAVIINIVEPFPNLTNQQGVSVSQPLYSDSCRGVGVIDILQL